MIPELYPLRTIDEISVYNKSFRNAIEELNGLIAPLEIPKKIILFNLLKPVYEQYADYKNFSNKLFNQSVEDPVLEGVLKVKFRIWSSFQENLYIVLKTLEFDVLMEESKCNCKLKQKLQIPLRSKSDLDLRFIKISDAYYNSELHQCPECETYWEYFHGQEDDSSAGWKPVTEKSLKQYGLI
jgi:hypothetical protein